LPRTLIESPIEFRRESAAVFGMLMDRGGTAFFRAGQKQAKEHFHERGTGQHAIDVVQ